MAPKQIPDAGRWTAFCACVFITLTLNLLEEFLKAISQISCL